jgi:hypothetical protein
MYVSIFWVGLNNGITVSVLVRDMTDVRNVSSGPLLRTV